MKIAISGAGGLVGACLAQELAPTHPVYALKRADLDITDREAVKRWIDAARPDLIINCAVAQVDPCERDPQMAAAINTEGPRHLAEAAAEIGAEIIHFSTNYVFDGKRTDGASYTVEDETLPINVYGRSKLEGEQAVAGTNPRSYIIRTAWVYGLGKESFLASVPRKLRRGERVEAIVDIYSMTTYVRDLAARTVEIISRGRHGIYQVANEGVCSYYEFAAEAARLVGLAETEAGQLIVKRRESEMNRPAQRPVWTPLRCLLSAELGLPPLRDWRSALADYIHTDLKERS
jgi:dTDP-4-dehydrorhamnose reductase